MRILPVLLTLLAAGCGSAKPPPELVFHNAAVWTADPARPGAQAIAVQGERISAVGSNDEILALAGPDTETIDLAGAFVVPGFIDTHVHFGSAARFLEFNIMRVSTQDQFVERVAEVVDRLPDGEWILGGFWGAYDRWMAGSAGGEAREPFTPDMQRVEALTETHPMFIRKFDGSQFAANRAALRAAGVEPEKPSVPNVQFELDAEGRATGIFSGNGAADLFSAKAPSDFSRERRIQQTKNALKEIRRRGVTTVSDMSDDLQLDIYRELLEKGELTVRVDFRYPLDRWSELAEQGVKRLPGDEWIRLGSLKGHIDGIMGTSSARFFEPYENDPENRGRWRRLMVDEEGNFVEGQFLRYMLDADRAGLQLTVHAIGDEANHLLLDYLEELNRRNGSRDRRFRVVHAQVIAEDDFARLGPLGVVAEVQPFHLSDDMRWMEERIGPERIRGAYAFRDILEGGARLCFGSDWPGTSASEYPINPMLGLYAAVARKTLTGQPEEGWFADQRLSMEEALRAYTIDAAYAGFEEDFKGSIEVGKLADLAVLDRNLLEVSPEEALEAEALFTVVGGRIVYRRPAP